MVMARMGPARSAGERATRRSRHSSLSVGGVARAAVLVFVGVGVFAITLAVSVSSVFAESRPATTLAWSPNNAIARANLAALLVVSDRVDQGGQFAVESLRRSPVNVAALRALGLATEARGDERSALRLFERAHALSRRDQAVELWWIQHYIRRGDGMGAIRHFDIALRASSRNWSSLLALMAGASADPRLIEPLDRKLAERPAWLASFLAQLVDTGPRLDHVARLIRARLDPSNRDDRASIQRFLNRAVASGELDLAWQVYTQVASGRPNLRPASLRDGGFEQADGYAPFDWVLVDEANLGALRDARDDQRGRGNVLRLMASNGRTGEVARQLVRLNPGNYRFEAETGALPVDEAARPAFAINCLGPQAATLLSFRPPGSGRGPFRVGGRFSVPTNCRWQVVSVQIGAPRTATEDMPWIDNLAVRPL